MTDQLTDSRRGVLRALADNLFPALDRDADPTGFWATSGGDLGADAGVAQALLRLPPEQLHGVLALLDGLHVLGFATASQRSCEQLLRNVSLMGAAPAAGMSGLVALTLAFTYSAPDPRTGLNPTWQTFGYPGPPRVAPGGDEPLATFTPTGDVECDVCIVGSGAGGGLIAGVLAQAGHDVVVLEAGGSHNEADFSGLELPAFQQMFWRGGPTPTADFNVNLLAAATLGGGPTVNWSNCLRTPPEVREQWADESGLDGVDGPEFDRHLDAVWTRLGVNDRCSDLNGPHERMRDGAAALGLVLQDRQPQRRPGRYSPESAGLHRVRGPHRRQARRPPDLPARRRRRGRPGDRRLPGGARARRGRPRRRRAADDDGAARCARGASSSPAARSSRPPCCCAPGSADRPSAATCTCTRWPPSSGFYPRSSGPGAGAPMSAMVDEFADVEDGHGFLIESAQWATVDHRRGHRPRVGRASSRRRWRGSANAAWLIGLQRDRGHGTVSIDAAGDAVVRYALDRRGRRARRAARRSPPRFASTRPAERTRSSRSPRSAPAGGAARTSRRSSPPCSASRCAPAATSCSRPTR